MGVIDDEGEGGEIPVDLWVFDLGHREDDGVGGVPDQGLGVVVELDGLPNEGEVGVFLG